MDRLTIDSIGPRGEGIALTPKGRVFVAGTLPGETIRATLDGERGQLESVEIPSPDRVSAPCPLFLRCGGCAFQHWATGVYQEWKRAQVAAALAVMKLHAPVNPVIDATGDGRRRVTLHARFENGAWIAGFMAARSHRLVSVAQCLVLSPELDGASAVALRLARTLGGAKPLDIQITTTQGGLDVDIRGHGPLEPRRRSSLASLADSLDLARLSLHGDLIVERRPPSLLMGSAVIVPPPGGFLQATKAGEAALGQLAVDAIGTASPVADLFAGSGPFALRLAERAAIHAVELDEAALVALAGAARRIQGFRQVTIETRDLFARPLQPRELARFAAVVMDPPRAGAEAQARALAASTVPLVVSVSCDVTSFARDAAILVRGGYEIAGVTPVDQFVYSPHIEIVGVFRRPAARRKRRLLR